MDTITTIEEAKNLLLTKFGATRDKKQNLRLNDDRVSVFYGRYDKTLLLANHTTNKTIKFSTFLLNNRSDIDVNIDYSKVEIEHKQNTQSLINNFKNSIIDITSIADSELDILLEPLQVKAFHPTYKELLQNKQFLNIVNINTLTNQDGINKSISINNLNMGIEFFNIRYKQTGGIWKTIKDGRNAGFYFKSLNHTNNLKKDLLIVEGAKDGLNTYLYSLFSNINDEVDIFTIDSKNTLNNPKLKELLSTDIYNKFYLCLDKDYFYLKDGTKKDNNLLIEDIEKLELKQNIKKRFNFIEWDKIIKSLQLQNLNSKNLDISDIIEELTKSENRINLLQLIETSSFSLIDIENIAFIGSLKRTLEDIEINNKRFLIPILKEKYTYLNSNVTEHLKDKVTPLAGRKEILKDISKFLIKDKTNFTDIAKLNINKYLTEQKENIINIIFNHKLNIINSPAGSGKSHFIKELAKHHKILIISPLEAISKEFINQDVGLVTNYQFEIDFKSRIANNKSITITTDLFMNKYHFIEDNKLFNQFDYIVFDEQHIISQSLNFRSKVINTHNKLIKLSKNKDIKANIIYLSGTPIKTDNNTYKVIEVNRAIKTNIQYTKETHKDIHLLINREMNILKDNSSLLLYVSSLIGVTETIRVIKAHFGIEHNNILENNQAVSKDGELIQDIEKDFIIVVITSKKRYYINNRDGKELEIKELKELDNIIQNKKVLYIATSKVATGVNLPNLKTIVQYGTAYTSENLIQLYNRLREDGKIIKVNTREKKQDYTSKTSKVIGLNTFLNSLYIRLESNSLKYILEKREVKKIIKEKTNIKNITINNFYKEYKELLTILSSNQNIELTSVKSIDGEYEIEDIISLQSEDKELKNIDDIDLDKRVNIFLAKWGEDNIIEFNKLYNTSQIFNIDKIDNNGYSNKTKTIETKEEIKEDKKKLQQFKLELLEKYFNTHTTLKDGIDTHIKLFKNVHIVEMEKIVNKSIADNKPTLDNALKKCRYAKDMDKYIIVLNGISKLILEAIGNLSQVIEKDGEYKTVITIKELISELEQDGENIKIFKSGTSNILKSIILEFLEISTIKLKDMGWKYSKDRVRVKRKQYRNIIYKI